MKWLEESNMDTLSNNKEKRKRSRTMVSLPLHFQANENEGIYPGLTIDASETGLLIQTLREIPVGTRIDIEVLFPKNLNLANFKAEAAVVWKRFCNWKDWRGYQYGLKFIQVSREDYLKLRQILTNISCLKEIDFVERRDHLSTLVVTTE